MPIDPTTEIHHAHLIAELRTDLSTTTARLDAALIRIDDLERGHAEMEACQSAADEEIAALRVKITNMGRGQVIVSKAQSIDSASIKELQDAQITMRRDLRLCLKPSVKSKMINQIGPLMAASAFIVLAIAIIAYA